MKIAASKASYMQFMILLRSYRLIPNRVLGNFDATLQSCGIAENVDTNHVVDILKFCGAQPDVAEFVKLVSIDSNNQGISTLEMAGLLVATADIWAFSWHLCNDIKENIVHHYCQYQGISADKCSRAATHLLDLLTMKRDCYATKTGVETNPIFVENGKKLWSEIGRRKRCLVELSSGIRYPASDLLFEQLSSLSQNGEKDPELRTLARNVIGQHLWLNKGTQLIWVSNLAASLFLTTRTSMQTITSSRWLQ